jgi:peptidoglycan/LPS O-acetylase OafA/YrhL
LEERRADGDTRWYPISRLSYGMYLNHLIFLPGITAWCVRRTLELSGSLTVATYAGIVAGIAVSMGFALVTFVLVERPFLLLRAAWQAQLPVARMPATSKQGLIPECQ